MLSEGHMHHVTDFPDSGKAFPGVQIKGGVCYFLWDGAYKGTCNVTRIAGGEENIQRNRRLGEFDVFVRDERALGILRKVLANREPSVLDLVLVTPLLVSQQTLKNGRRREAQERLPFTLSIRASERLAI